MRARHTEEVLCTEADPNAGLLYRLRPNECGHNSQGYRDREHAFEKPPGVFRIVVIGDSVAAGSGVAVEESFPRVLETMLNASRPGRFEVVLLGRPGYSTSQELILLETEAPKYDPDLILWSYVLNDPADPVRHDANGELGRYYHSPAFHLVDLIESRLFARRERRRSRGCPSEFHARLHCAYWDQVESSFARLGRVASESGKPIVVVLHPVFEKGRDFESYSLSNLHEKLGELARRHGLALLDLLAAHRGHDPDDLKVPGTASWYDPWHPNAEGHRVAAKAIADDLAGR